MQQYYNDDPPENTYTQGQVTPTQPGGMITLPAAVLGQYFSSGSRLAGGGGGGGTSGGRPAVDYGAIIAQMGQTVQQIGRLNQGGINTVAGGGSYSSGGGSDPNVLTPYQSGTLANQAAQLAQQASQFNTTSGLSAQQQNNALALGVAGLNLDALRLQLQAGGMDADNAYRYAALAQQGGLAGLGLGLQAQNQALQAAYQGDSMALARWQAENAATLAQNQFGLSAWQTQNQVALDTQRQQLAEILGQGNLQQGWAQVQLAERDMDLKKFLGEGNLQLGAAQVNATIQRLGLDRYGIDVNAALEGERNRIQAQVAAAQTEVARAQAQAEMAKVEATLRSIELQRELGLGDLALGQRKADDALRLGLENINVAREDLGLKERIATQDRDLQRMLGTAGLDVQRYGIQTNAATSMALGNLDAETRRALAELDARNKLDVVGMGIQSDRELATLDAQTRRDIATLQAASDRYGVDVNAMVDMYRAQSENALTQQNLAQQRELGFANIMAGLRGPRDYAKYQEMRTGLVNGVPGYIAAMGGAPVTAMQGNQNGLTPEAVTLPTFMQDSGLAGMAQAAQPAQLPPPPTLPQWQQPQWSPLPQFSPLPTPSTSLTPSNLLPTGGTSTSSTAGMPAAPRFAWEGGPSGQMPAPAPMPAQPYTLPPTPSTPSVPMNPWDDPAFLAWLNAQMAQQMAPQQAPPQAQQPAPPPPPENTSPTPTPASATPPPAFNTMDALIEDSFIRGKLAEMGVDLGGVAYSGEGMRALAARYGIQLPQTSSANAGPPSASVPPTASTGSAAAMPSGAATPPPATQTATMATGSAGPTSVPAVTAGASGVSSTGAPPAGTSGAPPGYPDWNSGNYAVSPIQFQMPAWTGSSIVPPQMAWPTLQPYQAPPPPTWQPVSAPPLSGGTTAPGVDPWFWQMLQQFMGGGFAQPPAPAQTGSMAGMVQAGLTGGLNPFAAMGQVQPSVPTSTVSAPAPTAPAPPATTAPTVPGATTPYRPELITQPARTTEQQIALLGELYGPDAVAAYQEWQRNPSVDPWTLPSVQAVSRRLQEAIGSFAPEMPEQNFLAHLRNAPVTYETPRAGVAIGNGYTNTMATSPDNTQLNNAIAQYNYLANYLQSMGGSAAGQLGFSSTPDPTRSSSAPTQPSTSGSTGTSSPQASGSSGYGITNYAQAMTGGTGPYYTPQAPGTPVGGFTAGGSGLPTGTTPLGGTNYSSSQLYPVPTGVSTSPYAVAPNGLPATGAMPSNVPLGGSVYNPYPGYETGTTYVPQTGPAILHEGEAVVPADQNPFNPAAAPSLQGSYGSTALLPVNRRLPAPSVTNTDTMNTPLTSVSTQAAGPAHAQPSGLPGLSTTSTSMTQPTTTATTSSLDALYPQFAGWVDAQQAAGVEPSTLFPQFDWGGANPQQWATYTPQQKASALFVTGMLPLDQAIPYGATDMLGNPLRAVASGFPDTGTGTGDGYLYGTPDTISVGLANLGYADTAANREWFQQQGIALARTPAPPNGGFASPPLPEWDDAFWSHLEQTMGTQNPALAPAPNAVSGMNGGTGNGTAVSTMPPPPTAPQTAGAPAATPYSQMLDQWRQQIPAPNQLVGRNWFNLPPSAQQQFTGIWEALGYDAMDLPFYLQQSLPGDVAWRGGYAAVGR